MAGTDIQGTGRKKLRWQITLIIVGMSMLKFLVNLLVWGNYELHREAYISLVYADHPAWGYIENPPFIMAISWISVKIFGGSAFALRLFPALVGGISMLFLGKLTKELNGKKWAVILATVSYLVAPVFLKSNSLYLPAAFNEFFWFSYLYFFVKLLQTHNKNYWFVLGFVAGLGFLTSYTIFIPVALTTLFLAATRHRGLLRCGQITGFGFNFFLFAIPNLIWQFNHNWPEFKNLRELNATQLVNMDSAWFLAMQLIMLAPVIFIWIAGLINLFTAKESRPYIVLGYSYLAMIVLMLLMHAKPYYPAPFYMILLIFGAIQWENWLEEKFSNLLRGLAIVMIAATIPLLPLSLPYLKVEKLISFSERWKSRGLEAPFVWEDGVMHSLPQDYADMIGWQSMNETLTAMLAEVPAEERSSVVVYCENSCVAAAIGYINRKDDHFPLIASLDGSFLLWSKDSLDDYSNFLLVDVSREWTEQNFETITESAILNIPNSRLNGMQLHFAHSPKQSFHEAYHAQREVGLEKYVRKHKKEERK
jgi:hypothetical protein